ncbi:MAG: polysaccharide biosynthesis/export family protein [Aestuariivirga sp.]
MRLISGCLLFAAVALSGCIEDRVTTAAAGGVGINLDGQVSQGPGTISTVGLLPIANRGGPVPPFGARGERAAYEYANGYRVGSGDKLTIRVAGEPDLTGEFPVDANGSISLPYVQTITVAGMATPQIEDMIAARLRNGYLRDPKVSVQTVSLRPFYILGEVTTAGSYAYQPGLTVQEAIAIAAGFGPRADKTAVQLTRRDIRGTSTTLVPLTTQIYPGDIISVRERWF